MHPEPKRGSKVYNPFYPYNYEDHETMSSTGTGSGGASGGASGDVSSKVSRRLAQVHS